MTRSADYGLDNQMFWKLKRISAITNVYYKEKGIFPPSLDSLRSSLFDEKLESFLDDPNLEYFPPPYSADVTTSDHLLFQYHFPEGESLNLYVSGNIVRKRNE